MRVLYETYRRELMTLTFDHDCRSYKICVLVLCQSTKWKFRSMATGQTYHVTLTFNLFLEVMALADDAGLSPASAHQL